MRGYQRGIAAGKYGRRPRVKARRNRGGGGGGTPQGVAPAKAGAHTPRRNLFCAMVVGSPSTIPAGGYGPRPSPGRQRCLRPQRGTCALVLATRIVRALLSRCHSFLKRAQGKPGADCARSAVCKKWKQRTRF